MPLCLLLRRWKRTPGFVVNHQELRSNRQTLAKVLVLRTEPDLIYHMPVLDWYLPVIRLAAIWRTHRRRGNSRSKLQPCTANASIFGVLAKASPVISCHCINSLSIGIVSHQPFFTHMWRPHHPARLLMPEDKVDPRLGPLRRSLLSGSPAEDRMSPSR